MKRLTSAPKRSSTRVSVVSKAMKVVDADTRREVRSKRLLALEADNYSERGGTTGDDDAYEDEDEDDHAAKIPEWKKKKKKKGALGAKKLPKKVRSLDRLIDHQLYQRSQEEDNVVQVVNYLAAAADASTKPARKFCSVCGYFADYSCTRCGMRFCTIRCSKNHKETRCLQQSHF